jgi:HlyD family secretion protein
MQQRRKAGVGSLPVRDVAVRRWWWLVLLGLSVAGSAIGYGRWQAEPTSGLRVETARVALGDVRRVVATSGAVRPLVTVEVGSQLSGQIKEVYADSGSAVHQGQEIARIDPRTFETRVREVEAAVRVAEAGAELQRAGTLRAEANLRQAEREYRRAEALRARGNTSQAVLDSALAALEAAQAGLAIARAEVANADATVQQRHAALDSARIDLDRTFIRSPINGVVIERSVEVGQTVAASLSAPKLFAIAQDLTRIEIDAQVDEADIGQVAVGQSVSFAVDAYPDRTFSGTVDQIRLAATTLQNVVTYTAVIAAANEDGRLLPGMTANVEILTAERRGVRTVPNEALRFRPRGAAAPIARLDGERAGSPGVWILAADGALVRENVAVGLSDRDVTQLTSPSPAEGTPVVVRVREPAP